MIINHLSSTLHSFEPIISAEIDQPGSLEAALMNQPELVTQTDVSGNTLLHATIECYRCGKIRMRECRAILCILLNQPNINLNAINMDGNTPLHLLFKKREENDKSHTLMVDELINLLSLFKGHTVDTRIKNDKGYTLLHLAGQSSHHMPLDEMLNPHTYTSLQLALSTFTFETLDDLSHEGASALANAIVDQCIANIQALINAGANPNAHENPSFDALHLMPRLLDRLKRYQFSTLETQRFDHYEKAIQVITTIIEQISASKPVQRRFKALLRGDVKHLAKHIRLDSSLLTAQDEDRMTLYHHIAKIETAYDLNTPVIDLLFKQSAVDLSKQDYADNTPLHYVLMQLGYRTLPENAASTITYPKFISLMKQSSFRFETTNKGLSTVYHLAAKCRSKQLPFTPLDLLLDGTLYHPVIDHRDTDGHTALTLACQISDNNNIECLIKHGANPKLKNSDPFPLYINSAYPTRSRIDPLIVVLEKLHRYKARLAQTIHPDTVDFINEFSHLLIFSPPSKSDIAKQNAKIHQCHDIISKMRDRHRVQDSIALQEIKQTAATLSQGIRHGHIFSVLPREALVKFALFSTRARYQNETIAMNTATTSLQTWLAEKTTPKKSIGVPHV